MPRDPSPLLVGHKHILGPQLGALNSFPREHDNLPFKTTKRHCNENQSSDALDTRMETVPLALPISVLPILSMCPVRHLPKQFHL